MLDEDDPGHHIALYPLPDNKGYLRVSDRGGTNGPLRASILTDLKPSISYAFVADEAQRRQLEHDNVRMQLAARAHLHLGTVRDAPGVIDFVEYCLFAQYQMEVMMRYANDREQWVSNDSNPKYDPTYNMILSYFMKTEGIYVYKYKGDSFMKTRNGKAINISSKL
jgi:hypothetical protein